MDAKSPVLVSNWCYKPAKKKDSKKNEKRFPQRNEHQTNDAVDGDGIPHTEFKAIWPFRHDMLSSEAYVTT